MNTPNTDKLIELIDQFPTIKRIEFDNDNHREFVKKLLLACKNVRPELDALKLLAHRPLPVPDPALHSENVKPAIEAPKALTASAPAAADPVQPAIAKARRAATRSRTKPSDIAKSS